ncbi:hypothetical protein Ciccas_002182 [Cichlidogyrus casuarinus]|uniref:Uncharacterized protein n=1 Tax=Cichlidogyrus casuarinus TaxID=1844966 RepID=A0ABD2QI70_9PLAT
MQSDISRIPIISISGCQSISDYVNSLPLPKNVKTSSRLLDSDALKLSESLANNPEESLTNSLVLALGSTNTDDLNFEEKYDSDKVDISKLPPFFNSIVNSRQSVFANNRSFKCIWGQIPEEEQNKKAYDVVKSESKPLKLSIKLSSLNSDVPKEKEEKEKHKKKKKTKYKHIHENGSISSLPEPLTLDHKAGSAELQHPSSVKTDSSDPAKVLINESLVPHVFKGALLNFAPQPELDSGMLCALYDSWNRDEKAPHSVATDAPSALSNGMHLNQASNHSNPQSVGANLAIEDPLSMSRSPQSLPSNCSYPATPGNLSLQNPLSVPLTSPLTSGVNYASKYGHGPSPASVASVTPCSSSQKKPHSPPVNPNDSGTQMSGLAAYLPPSQQRELSPQAASETQEIERSYKSNQSPYSYSKTHSRASRGKPKGE